MTSKQRAYLKSLATNIDPVIQIGKCSVTPELTMAVAEAFHTKELIKLHILQNCSGDAEEMAQMIAERTSAQVVQVIGRMIVLYKPDKEKQKIILPGMKAPAPKKKRVKKSLSIRRK